LNPLVIAKDFRAVVNGIGWRVKVKRFRVDWLAGVYPETRDYSG
jgi:hypothetical protein